MNSINEAWMTFMHGNTATHTHAHTHTHIHTYTTTH